MLLGEAHGICCGNERFKSSLKSSPGGNLLPGTAAARPPGCTGLAVPAAQAVCSTLGLNALFIFSFIRCIIYQSDMQLISKQDLSAKKVVLAMVASNERSRAFRWACADSADSCPIHHRRALAAERWPRSAQHASAAVPLGHGPRWTCDFNRRVQRKAPTPRERPSRQVQSQRRARTAQPNPFWAAADEPRDRWPVLLHAARGSRSIAAHGGSSRSQGSR